MEEKQPILEVAMAVLPLGRPQMLPASEPSIPNDESPARIDRAREVDTYCASTQPLRRSDVSGAHVDDNDAFWS